MVLLKASVVCSLCFVSIVLFLFIVAIMVQTRFVGVCGNLLSLTALPLEAHGCAGGDLHWTNEIQFQVTVAQSLTPVDLK